MTISVPSTHKIELRSKVSRWRNDSEKLERIRQKLKRKQYFSDSETVQALTLCGDTKNLIVSAASD